MFEFAATKAAICRATNRSEIAGCSHARFAVAVKSPFDRSSCRAIKSLCVNEPLESQLSHGYKEQPKRALKNKKIPEQKQGFREF